MRPFRHWLGAGDGRGVIVHGSQRDVMIARRAVFDRHGWLSKQPASVRHAVFADAQPVQVSRAQRIYAEGDAPGGIYGILSGGIGVELSAGRGTPRLAHIHRAGVWFGEGPVLDGGRRSMGFVATEESELLHVPLHALRKAMAQVPELGPALAIMAHDGMNLGARGVRELLIADAPRRIAAVLVRVTCADEAEQAGTTDDFQVSHAMLGEMANASRHTTMRALADFAGRGWIAKHYGHVRVTDAERLRDFAWQED